MINVIINQLTEKIYGSKNFILFFLNPSSKNINSPYNACSFYLCHFAKDKVESNPKRGGIKTSEFIILKRKQILEIEDDAICNGIFCA
jgi:hypothetical protein